MSEPENTQMAEQTAPVLPAPVAIHPVSGKPFPTGTTEAWFAKAVPAPTSKNVHVQLGVHFEEVAETLTALSMQGAADQARAALAKALDDFAKALKTGDIYIDVVHTDWPEVGDGLGDTRVTATGSLHAIGAAVSAIIKEIDDSNFSKFVDGKAVFDENGKIAKGPDFFRPDVKKYIPATPPAFIVPQKV